MTIAEAVLEKLKKLPLEKQQDALRYVESLQTPTVENETERQRHIDEFLADMHRGCFEKVEPYTREELNERHSH